MTPETSRAVEVLENERNRCVASLAPYSSAAYRESCEAKIAALTLAIASLSAPQAVVPEGMVLVPVEANTGIRGVLYRTKSGFGDDYMTPEQATHLWAELLQAANPEKERDRV